MMLNKKGDATIIVLAVVAVVGVAAWLFKPRSIHGESRRADESARTTERVNAATDEVLEAERKKGAQAAASVTKIGEAAAESPESPAKSFITREVPLALASLPTPDPMALIEAERRKSAVMEGRYEEASRLYKDAFTQVSKLQQEKEEALIALEKARLERQKADQAILEAAAANRAMQMQRNLFIGLCVLVGVLWIWAKITHFSPSQIASSVRDIRAKTYQDPIEALDVSANRLQQKIVRWLS